MVRTLTRNALLTALGLCLALVEQLVPLPVPLPGVRLGLANVITLYLLLTDTPGSAAAVLPEPDLDNANVGRYRSTALLVSFCADMSLQAYPHFYL